MTIIVNEQPCRLTSLCSWAGSVKMPTILSSGSVPTVILSDKLSDAEGRSLAGKPTVGSRSDVVVAATVSARGYERSCLVALYYSTLY